MYTVLVLVLVLVLPPPPVVVSKLRRTGNIVTFDRADASGSTTTHTTAITVAAFTIDTTTCGRGNVAAGSHFCHHAVVGRNDRIVANVIVVFLVGVFGSRVVRNPPSRNRIIENNRSIRHLGRSIRTGTCLSNSRWNSFVAVVAVVARCVLSLDVTGDTDVTLNAGGCFGSNVLVSILVTGSSSALILSLSLSLSVFARACIWWMDLFVITFLSFPRPDEEYFQCVILQ